MWIRSQVRNELKEQCRERQLSNLGLQSENDESAGVQSALQKAA